MSSDLGLSNNRKIARTVLEEVDLLRATSQPKRRGTPERDLQRVCIRWLRTVLPGAVVAAVPNEQRGAGRTSEQRMRFGAARKASGVLPGFPDLTVWPVAQRAFLVELKAPKGALSENQREMHERLRAAGHPVILANSLDALRDGVRGIGIQTIEAAP